MVRWLPGGFVLHFPGSQPFLVRIFFLLSAKENEFNGADNTNHSEQADKAKNDVSQNPIKGAFVGYADDAPVGQALQKVNPILAHDKLHVLALFLFVWFILPRVG